MATAAGRERRVPGEVGTWVFILGDMTVFAVLFATYLYYRADDPAGFATSQQELSQTFGAVNTLLLLLSSLLVVAAVRTVRIGAASKLAPRLVVGAMACGLAFSVLKIVEYQDKIAGGHTPAADDFFLYYFVLTGMHWFHLIIGLAVLTALLVLSRKPSLTKGQLSFFDGGACFWHMVDMLWIVLFPLLYFVR